VTAPNLAAALQLPVTVLLGEADTDPEHASLNRSPEALAQGPHRYARGLNFFETASKAAGWSSVPFGWQLATVPGADHDNRKMAPAALPYLLYDVAAAPPAEPALTVLPQTGR
jgi:alpha-beta hydrolase superfamily lysophospholipase